MQSYQRIESLDLIRGVAVLGILYMNIFNIIAPIEAYTAPLWSVESGPLDEFFYMLQSLFFESRFMSIFSLLFGVGLTLQWDRFVAREQAPKLWLRRRLRWLLLFGLIHGVVFWLGDILATYAICGMLLLTMMHWQDKTKIKVGILFIIIAQPLMLLLVAASLITGENLMQFTDLPMSLEQIAELRAKQGTLAGWLGNAGYYIMFLFVFGPLFIFWQVTGIMLIGSGLYRMGFFDRFHPLSLVLLVVGFIWGLAVYYFRVAVGIDTSASQATVMLMMPAGLMMGIGYASLLTLFAKRTNLVVRALKSTGKTAFTVYLSQSIVMVLVFQWLFPQWWGVLSRAEGFLLVSMYLLLQVTLAHWWQTKHGQGPMEKLWRKLAYRKLERQQG